MRDYVELKDSKAGDEIGDLNLWCKDIGVGHLFCHTHDAKQALAKVHQIGEHLETLLMFARDRKLGASIVDLELAIECSKRALEELYAYRELEDNWNAPQDTWHKGDER